MIPSKSFEYATTVATNLYPIFEYYRWEYTMSGGVPSAHDIYLNIISLMQAAASQDGGVAESGRIRVEYNPHNHPKEQPFGVYLGTLDQITRE